MNIYITIIEEYIYWFFVSIWSFR